MPRIEPPASKDRPRSGRLPVRRLAGSAKGEVRVAREAGATEDHEVLAAARKRATYVGALLETCRRLSKSEGRDGDAVIPGPDVPQDPASLAVGHIRNRDIIHTDGGPQEGEQKRRRLMQFERGCREGVAHRYRDELGTSGAAQAQYKDQDERPRTVRSRNGSSRCDATFSGRPHAVTLELGSHRRSMSAFRR